MNWGKGIVLAFTLFIIFIVSIVVRVFSEDFDLVADNYYAKELYFEKKQEKQANLRELGKKIVVTQEKNQVLFDFSDINGLTKGQIYFYHLSKKMNDVKANIDLRGGKKQIIDKKQLVKGAYKIIFDWSANGKEYFQQEQIYIQ